MKHSSAQSVACGLVFCFLLRNYAPISFVLAPSTSSRDSARDAVMRNAAEPLTRQAFRSVSRNEKPEPAVASGIGLTCSLVLGLAVGSLIGMGRYGGRHMRKAVSARQAVVSKSTDEKQTDLSKSPAIVEAPANLREWRLEAAAALQGGPWPAPKNDRLLRAARGEKVDRPPKWMHRQAGRYLPEYRAVLQTSDFFTVCKTPSLACEVTLQPYRRYNTLDSLIIFSDILVIPVAMGMPCRMHPDSGPQFDFALETPADLERLNLTPDVQESLGYVFDAIFWTRNQVQNDIPVIGFSGGPWSLMAYMVEGGSARSFDRAKKWLYLYPEASHKLLGALSDIIVEYLVAQYDSGAPLLQVFETSCGELPPNLFEEFCVPHIKKIAAEVKKRRPEAIMSLFPKDGEIGVFNESDFDVISVSWGTSPAQARAMCPSKTLQGNLDPHALFADAGQIKQRVKTMMREFGTSKYIVNLGHGMLPTHSVEGLQAFIDAVDED